MATASLLVDTSTMTLFPQLSVLEYPPKVVVVSDIDNADGLYMQMLVQLCSARLCRALKLIRIEAREQGSKIDLRNCLEQAR
jgi:hypothetical protein